MVRLLMRKHKAKTKASKLVCARARYQSKNWYSNDRFERLMRRIKTLNGEQKQLVLELTDKFEYIDLQQLILKVRNSLIALVNKKGCNVSSILIAPLKSPIINFNNPFKGRNYVLAGKEKSADYIFGIVARQDLNIKANIQICSSPKELIRFYKDNCCIALVDDFVGSGETATTHVREYMTFLAHENIKVKLGQFNIVVAAAMKDGVDKVNKYGIDCFAQDIMDKGITCDTTKRQYQRDKNVELMESIEEQLMPNMSKDYSFGYHHSEALISILDKAPNNTFPFYWYTQGMDTKAIFRRNYGG